MNTTPAQVRKLLKQHKLPYDITKTEGFWYVHGPDTVLWEHTNLMTKYFYGKSAEFWVDLIVGMHQQNRDRINLESADQESKDAFVAVDNFLQWQERVAS